MSESKETNINVVVRVRPRNQREVKENSQPIITANTKTKEVTVRQGSENNNSSKTYTFDKVFGPESTQEAIFEEVVDPILQEVLMGYNCTIFAYGQTGTGKTHTMEGNLNDIQGNEAGIIPRTLYKLFETLESVAEFSVRVSCLELYNEELNDLLSADDDNRKLRIFEDLNRKGSVVIQNLEEVLVKNAIDVIHTLQRGSLKRQTASTKMNEASSRSHCIFSITLHIKEATPDGEELLKVGKLNLVDLAGSENIGRSGAENKRAKEAGMINQSLLTLGRVINALVERSPHVPYRESKLTRLLQDSLGGKTKTCIIAAISPAKCNMDESLSTLEYAHRAKNIRNKPEINQKMTKRTLIKEYVIEIERLKADLSATREKNGIFMSNETYANLIEQNESRKSQIDEINRAIFVKEEQMVLLDLKFKQNTTLLNKTAKKLDETTAELELRKKELEEAIENMKSMRQELMEQKAITRAHAETEKKLDSIASDLVVSLKTSLHDMSGLHEKIERKKEIESLNLQAFSDLQVQVLDKICFLERNLIDMKKKTNSWTDELLTNMSKALVKSEEFFNDGKKLLLESLTTFENQVGLVADTSSAMKDIAITQGADSLQTIAESQAELHGIYSEAQRSVDEILNAFVGSVRSFKSQMLNQTEFVESQINQTLVLFKSLTKKQLCHTQDMKDKTNCSNKSELEFLRFQNQKLAELLVKEKTKTKAVQDRFKANFMEMMNEMDVQNDLSLNNLGNCGLEIINGLQQMIETHDKNTNEVHHAFSIEFNSNMEEIELGRLNIEKDILASKTILSEVNVIAEAGFDSTMKVLADYDHIIRSKNEENSSSLEEKMKRNTEELETMNHDIKSHAHEFRQMSNVLKQSTIAHNENNLTDISCLYKGIVERCKSHSSCHDKLNESVLVSTQYIESQIKEKRLSSDQMTGKTPKKINTIQIPDRWELTKRHEDIVNELRLQENNENDDKYERIMDSDTLLQSKLPKTRLKEPTSLRDMKEQTQNIL